MPLTQTEVQQILDKAYASDAAEKEAAYQDMLATLKMLLIHQEQGLYGNVWEIVQNSVEKAERAK